MKTPDQVLNTVIGYFETGFWNAFFCPNPKTIPVQKARLNSINPLVLEKGIGAGVGDGVGVGGVPVGDGVAVGPEVLTCRSSIYHPA